MILKMTRKEGWLSWLQERNNERNLFCLIMKFYYETGDFVEERNNKFLFFTEKQKKS